MSLYFAIGMQGTQSRLFLGQSPEQARIVEYLEFDLNPDNPCVGITGDFFLTNHTNRDSLVKILQQGNIDFAPVPPEEVLSPDSFESQFLRRAYLHSSAVIFQLRPPEIAVSFDILNEVYQNFSIDRNVTDGFSRISPAAEGHVPFSLYSVKVPAQARVFLRIRGELKGKSLDVLRMDSESCPQIIGGDELLRDISKQIDCAPKQREEYSQLMTEFANSLVFPQRCDSTNSLIVPHRYDFVIWGKKGSKGIRSYAISHEPTTNCEGAKFQGRVISWYWAPLAFYYEPGFPNGPRIAIHPVREKKRKGLQRLAKAFSRF